MTALGGCWSFQGKDSELACLKILDAQRAYGNDGVVRSKRHLSLGRRLLAQLPEDKFDHGPVHLGPILLTGDVRLDNREQLLLELGGNDAQQMSDCEVAARCIAAWGYRSLDRFVGEFALAWHDERTGKLSLARDILGSRPLVYAKFGDGFAFSSMPSGLHAIDGVPRAVDTDFAGEQLAQLAWTDERTHFSGVSRVLPAHCLIITPDTQETVRYWSPSPRIVERSREEIEEGIRAILSIATLELLRGCGQRVGTHLSAGLDSSIVTATVAGLRPDLSISAFTVVPSPGDPAPVPEGMIGDERQHAQQLAGQFGNIEHVIVECDGSPLEALDRQFAFEQKPADNICNAVWGRAIAREAKRRSINVMLTGSLGNMTLSYEGYEHMAELVAGGKFLEAVVSAWTMRHEKSLSQSIARAFGPFLPDRLWRIARRLKGKQLPFSMLTLSEKQKRKLGETAQSMGKPARSAFSARSRMINYRDGGNYLKAMLAEYGLAIRDPMADKRVIEYCLSIPTRHFIGGGSRSLARSAFADRLPQSIREERRRGYQAANWLEMIRRDVATVEAEVGFVEHCSPVNEVLDGDELKRLAHWVLTAKPSAFDPTMEEGIRYNLLRSLSFSHFARRVEGTN